MIIAVVAIIGVTFSHMKFFESVRNARLQRFSVPTNQLIIRLDKLLENMPTDPLKKKGKLYTILYID